MMKMTKFRTLASVAADVSVRSERDGTRFPVDLPHLGAERDIARARGSRILPAPHRRRRGRTCLRARRYLGKAQGRIERLGDVLQQQERAKAQACRLIDHDTEVNLARPPSPSANLPRGEPRNDPSARIGHRRIQIAVQAGAGMHLQPCLVREAI